MAHGFRNLGKATTFVSRKELAWHRLGKVVDAMTSKEAIELAGLDFNVELAPLFAGVGSNIDLQDTPQYPNIIRQGQGNLDNVKFNSGIELPGNFATYRTDNNHVFGVVGSRYEIIQNSEAFEFFDSIIGEGHAEYETAGALGDGEKVFITAKLPNKLIVNKEDIDKYLLLTMAHDGSGAIQAMFTPIRVVCNNTLSCALGSATNKVSIRHTKNARLKLEIAKKVLGIVERQTSDLSVIFNRFADVRLDELQLEAVICDSFGFTKDEEGNFSTRVKNKFEEILEYHEVGVGQKGIQGTAWGAFNAITGYQQNVQNFKNESAQFESINNKGAATIRQKAFNNLIQLSR